ncbi:MAG: NAD-dependent epimerase/dehydratase family protein [Planctomycetota bacterium]
MNVLITGSSGQIGTNVGLALMNRGNRVVGIDRRLNTWTPKIHTIQLDLTTAKPDSFPTEPRFDVVLHFAAHAKVFELVEKPERAMENVVMTFAALEYCRRHNIPLIFSSSREVYGDIHRHVTDESSADFVVAESPYSASKIAGEAMLYSFAQCYGLSYLVFRFSNVYGRYDNDLDRMERVIPLFMRRIARGEPIVVFGREKVLDFTYVDDCVAGVLAGIDALVSGKVVRQTVNLAYGQGNTLVDVVNILSLAVGREAKATYEPSRKGEVTRYVADINKARVLLDYEPRVPLSSGLIRAVEWSRSVGAI